MPFAGRVVNLNIQLHDNATDKHVRAIVIDETGAAVAGSPFTMSHKVAGKYTTNALLMPSGVEFLEATYEIYNEAAFTTVSEDHFGGTDSFPLEISDQDILDRLDEIINKINNIQAKGGDLLAALDADGELQAVMDDAVELRGLVEQEGDLSAATDSDGDLAAQVMGEEKQTGSIGDC